MDIDELQNDMGMMMVQDQQEDQQEDQQDQVDDLCDCFSETVINKDDDMLKVNRYHKALDIYDKAVQITLQKSLYTKSEIFVYLLEVYMVFKHWYQVLFYEGFENENYNQINISLVYEIKKNFEMFFQYYNN